MNILIKSKKAYSYQRFSSAKQRHGDSVKRQTEGAERFCKEHRLLLVDTFRDEGVSGYSGRNFSDESALSAFLKLVENGTIEKGSVLVVENMDRISRQKILPCLTKFQQIVQAGVGIGVISQNRIYDEESITRNPMDLMLVLVEFSRANSESEIKSVRSKANVQRKIDRIKAGEKIITIGKPTWIAGVKNGQWIVDEDKAELVKGIFTKYLAGHSATRIASDFNEDGTPTLSGVKRYAWATMTVLQILRNKNVMGWTAINGHEVDNYYPQIIDPKTFQLVQQKLSFNKSNRGGSKAGYINTLFKGLLTCSECGRNIEVKIAWYTDVAGNEKRYYTYTCSGVHRHTQCKNKGRILVTNFETAIFTQILNLSELTKKTEQANEVLNGLENKLAKNQMTLDRTLSLLDDETLGDLTELKDKLSELKGERQELIKQINGEKSKAVTVHNGFEFVAQLRSYFIRPTDKHAPPNSSLKDVAKFVIQKAMKGEPMIHQRVREYAREQVAEYLKDTKHREEIRNIMPSVIRGITMKFSKETVKRGKAYKTVKCVTANIEFATGTKQTINITNG